MRMNINHLQAVLWFAALIYAPALLASEKDLSRAASADSILHLLVKKGFENVAVVSDDKRLTVAYENRIYRDEVRAIKEVLNLVMPGAKNSQTVILVPQNRKTPLLSISIKVDDYRTFKNGVFSLQQFVSAMQVSFDTDSIWKSLRAASRANSSFYKFDLVIHPQFKAHFGNRRDPFESQLNLAPELSASFWKGLRFSGALIVPLQNELAEEEDFVRPGTIVLNQTLRLPRAIFLSAAIGYFDEQRYGVDFEIRKYSHAGRWAVAANLGYTGFASYLKGVWSYTDIDLLTASVAAEYRWPKLDLILRAAGGQFLDRDRGGRFELFRQFGEVDFGFYLVKTDAGENGGFHFSIPIFPAKYLPAARFRISPAKNFQWEYRYRRLDSSGRQFETGNRLYDFSKRLHPDYIKSQLLKFEDWDK